MSPSAKIIVAFTVAYLISLYLVTFSQKATELIKRRWKAQHETQLTVANFFASKFGLPEHCIDWIGELNHCLSELITVLCNAPLDKAKARVLCVEMIIWLYRIGSMLGIDIQAGLEKEMEVKRLRFKIIDEQTNEMLDAMDEQERRK